jgi:hypothetical protein
MRLGVSEACTRAILGSASGDRIGLHLADADGRLVVRIQAEKFSPPEDVDLLPALFDDFSVEGVEASFSVPTG